MYIFASHFHVYVGAFKLRAPKNENTRIGFIDIKETIKILPNVYKQSQIVMSLNVKSITQKAS